MALNVLIFLLYVFNCALRGNGEFIHLSPRGKDQPNCGISTRKCKTIDYAIGETKHNNITLVFETSATQSLNYTLTKPFNQKANTSTRLRFIKDESGGQNPTINGNTEAFIGTSVNDIEVNIDSINLYQVKLISMKKSNAKVRITIENAFVYIYREEFIVLEKHANKIVISIRHCLLQSKYYLDEKRQHFDKGNWQQLHVDKYILLNIEGLENKQSTNHIEITKSTIQGGRFRITNVATFHMKQCQIQKNFPKIRNNYYFQIDEQYISPISNIMVPKLALINLNDMANGKSIHTNHPVYATPYFNSIYLESVKEFRIENCNVKHMFMNNFLYATHSAGSLDSISFESNFLVRLMYAYSSTIHITNLKLDNTIVKTGMIDYNTIKFSHSEINITNFIISNVKGSDNEFFLLTHTKLTVNHLRIQHVEFPDTIFSTFGSSAKLILSDIQIEEIKCRNHIIYSIESMINIKQLKIIKSVWPSTERTIFRLIQSTMVVNEVQLNINTSTPAVFDPKMGTHLVLNNITVIGTYAPNTIFLDAIGKLTITKLQVINSTLLSVFSLLKSISTITDVQIVNTTLPLRVLVAKECNTVIQRLTTRNSLLAGLVHVVGEEGSLSKLVATDVRVEYTSVIDQGFLFEYGNVTIQHLNLVKTKMGNIFHTAKSIVRLSEMNVSQVQIMNVMFKSKANFNAFVFTADCRISFQGLQIIGSMIDEHVFFLDDSHVTIERTHMENNSYSSGFKILYSKVLLRDLKSMGNRALGHVKFINTKAASTLRLNDILIRLPEMLYFERAMDMIDTELYIQNVNIYTDKSFSLTFEVFKWEFNNIKRSEFTNLTLQCPNHFNVMANKQLKQRQESLTVSCQKCKDSTYPLISVGRKFNMTATIDKTNGHILEDLHETVLKCQDCPTGGICADGKIKARDNFHGFVNKWNEYEFILCPGDYCCNTDNSPCDSPSACSFNRTGTLCGQCEKDYFVNLEKKCVHNSKCLSRGIYLYWTMFFCIPIALAFIMTYASDIKYLMIRLVLYINCKRCIRRKRSVERKGATRKERNTTEKQISASATFNIIMTFYQLKALIIVKGFENNDLFVDQLFNIEWISRGKRELEYFCAFKGVDVITQEFLMGFMNPLVMVVTVLISLFVCKLLHHLKFSNKDKNLFTGRFYVGYYIVLAFSYKNICHTAFSFLNCKLMNDKRFLYIEANVECYQPWQIANIIFLVLWVFPFPLSVGLSYEKLRNSQISRLKFLMFLMFPFLGVFIIICKRFDKNLETERNYQKADDRLVEIFELPYKEKYLWWEGWRLMERFIVAGLSVFLTNPIYRILYITPVFAFFSYLHRRINPYKQSMFILKRLDAVSWVCLFLLSLLNEMRAVAYIYNIPNVDSINYALNAANILDKIFSPLWYFIISLILRRLRR